MIIAIVLGAFAAVSFGLMLWQTWLGWRFPMGVARASPAPECAFSLLKPLKGEDAYTRECLESWFAQSYEGPVQLLFGVADPDDPVCGTVRGLIASHPKTDATLMICPKRLGPNAKVSTLVQLAFAVRHENIVVSDADVWAPPTLLKSVAACLDPADVGLVTCLYSLQTPANLAMRLESIAVNADFWTQVLQARQLGKLDFALGAVMAVKASSLSKISGFEGLLQHLADDYQLGHRVARAGQRIELCELPVQCRSQPATGRQVWTHQVRWARTIRASEPWQYFLSILGNATLWPLLFLASAPAAAPSLWRPALLLAAISLVCRLGTAHWLQRRLTGVVPTPRWWLLPLLKDVAALAIWLAAFSGNTVEWRGRRFRVAKGGKLVEL